MWIKQVVQNNVQKGFKLSKTYCILFQPPVPAKLWSGIRDATKHGNECSQFRILTMKYTGGEDCLFLNVYTPSLPNQSQESAVPMPVMVYFHGGGFLNGSGNSEMFSPDFIVEQGTILVSINYRLSALGFLCLDLPEVPGNAGLRDQNLALKWIQQNIKYFGGNPENVTVVSISAGAACLEYHMLSPMSKDLFHKAILQSGSALCPYSRSKNPLDIAMRLVRKLGGTSTETKDMLDFLMKVDVKELLEVSMNLKNADDFQAGNLFLFVPVVEKTFKNIEPFLNREPVELLRSGQFMRIPSICGFAEKEGTIFKAAYDAPGFKQNLINLRFRRFINFLPKEYIFENEEKTDEKLRDLYKLTYENRNAEDMVNNFLSDLITLGPMFQSLHLKLPYVQPFMYMFSYDGNLNAMKKNMHVKDKGACHGDDAYYLCSSSFVSEDITTPKDISVRNRMVKMWTDFAKFG